MNNSARHLHALSSQTTQPTVPPQHRATQHSAPEPQRQRLRIDVAAVNAVMHQLTAHPDPETVFGEVADLIVPVVCDHVEVEVLTGLELARWIEAPTFSGDIPAPIGHPDGLSDPTSSVAGYLVTVHTLSPVTVATGGEYLARLTCQWLDGYPPTPADVALIKLIGRCAADAAVSAQHRHDLALERQVSVNLRKALDTNRQIGAAIGIVMSRYELSYERAFAALARASQNTNQRMVLLAAQVLHTGALPDLGNTPSQ